MLAALVAGSTDAQELAERVLGLGGAALGSAFAHRGLVPVEDHRRVAAGHATSATAAFDLVEFAGRPLQPALP